MKTPHLNALRAVEATLRLGTFARAAEELGVTPAAVGQQVRLLEDVLQCALFDRRPGGVVPTDAATRIAPALTDSFAALAGVLEDLAAANDPNRVWITTTEGVAEHWLPPHLPEFLSRHPGIDFRLDGTSTVRPLGRAGFDFAIRAMPKPDANTQSVPLFPNWVTPVCSPDFARRYRLGPETDSLEGVPVCESDLIVTDPHRMDWSDWCAANGIAWSPASVTASVNQTGGGLRMARAGLVLALVSAFTSSPAVKEGTLLMPFGPQGMFGTETNWYVLLWPPGRRLSPVQRAFRDWIAEAAQADREAFGA